MMDTVVCLIPDEEHVDTARRKLRKAGFARSDISVMDQTANVWKRLEGRQKKRIIVKDVVIGALLGLLIGALYGVPTSLFLCRYMDCPLETGILLWVLVSLYWVVGAGILGAVVGFNDLENEIYSYIEGVQRGERFLVVETPQEKVSEAVQILAQEQGSLIHEIHDDQGVPH